MGFSSFLFLLSLLSILVFYTLWKHKFKRWRHLPGPFSPLSFVFESAFTSNNPVLLRKLYNKYEREGLCFLPLVKIPLLLVGDFSKIKWLCSNPGSQGRFIVPNGPFFKFMHDFRLQKPGRISGILCSQGEIWKEQRNFMIKTLNILGLKNSSLEDIVLGKVESFCQFLKSKNGNSVEIAGLFDLSVLSILWKMTTGENIDFQDSKLQALSDGLHAATGFLGTPAALFSVMFPWIAKTFSGLIGLKQHKQFYSFLSDEIQDLIENHKETLDVDNPRDLIDHFLIDMNGTEEINEIDIEDKEEKLRTLIIDIFLGGDASTSSVLSFGFLFLLAHSEVQRKVQDEIDRVLGDNCPTLGQRKNMPYTQATINEILRYADIVPLDYRCTTEDVMIDEILIPKDTIVLNIVTEVMKGSYWKEAETFNPERFLDGSALTPPDERLIPFLMGKRSCPGQNLANMQLFLYFARILQQFDVQSEVKGVLPKDGFVPGITSQPIPFKVKFTQRNITNAN